MNTAEFPFKDWYHNFDTLAIPELYIYQLLLLAYKFLHHKHLLLTAFVNYRISPQTVQFIYIIRDCEKICI